MRLLLKTLATVLLTPLLNISITSTNNEDVFRHYTLQSVIILIKYSQYINRDKQ